MDNIRSTIIKSQPNPPAAPEAVDDDDPLGQLVAKSFVLADIVYEPLDHVQTTFGTAGYSDVERFECRRFGVQAIGCRQGDVAHLVIRGSDETVDWLLDIYAVPSFRPLHHRGFGLCWRRIEAPVRAWLDRLAADVTALRLTGHSLGGAVAQVAAMDLARRYPIDAVITFGAPRMAFGGTAEHYDRLPIAGDENRRLGDATLLVVHHRDLVARLPKWPFKEVGRLLYIDASGKLQRGDSARRSRHDTSMRDMTGLFPDLNAPIVPDLNVTFVDRARTRRQSIGLFPDPKAPIADPMPGFGVSATTHDRVEAALQTTWRRLGLVPPMQHAFLALYVWMAFWCQLVRSGHDHLLTHYAVVLAGCPDVQRYAPHWTFHLRRGVDAFGLVMGIIGLGIFVGGCWLIVRWIVWPLLRPIFGAG